MCFIVSFQVAAYHFCLGSLMYGLMAAAHPTVQELADNIAVRWIQQLAGHTSPNEVCTTPAPLAPTYVFMHVSSNV